MYPQQQKIAVVGGGVAGMSAAWHLQALGFAVKVFEKSDSIGGNARTFDVVVGDDTRWVDLGVNDFNADTYVSLYRVLENLGVESRPLEDTTCFFTLDGALTYTLDGLSNTVVPEAIARDEARFRSEALEVLTGPRYRHTLVSEYVEEKGYSDEFVHCYLYPRINAMYFGNVHGAGNTPMWPVMKYYSLQEGLGGSGPSQPKRMYFVNGSREWMTNLYNAAKAKFPVVLNAEASIHADTAGVTVDALGHVERFDAAVVALQAKDALLCMKAGLTEEVSRFLGSFKYRSDEAVAHTFYGVLPPDVKAWRTYNILIRRNPNGAYRYTMTYLVNRHQNEGAGSGNGAVATPHFFVTLNPQVPIPESHVLKQPDGTPARTEFQHLSYDLDALKAQERRDDIQGINNVYVAGGYARGAGLHEECWADGMELARQIKREREAAGASNGQTGDYGFGAAGDAVASRLVE